VEDDDDPEDDFTAPQPHPSPQSVWANPVQFNPQFTTTSGITWATTTNPGGNVEPV
jgi:hypothetical protein